MQIPSASFVLSLLAAAVLIGCENADSEKGVYWNGTPQKPAAQKPAAQQSATTQQASTQQTSNQSSGTAAAPAGQAAAGDAVPFSSLRWSYGGANGSGAQPSAVTISGLSCSRSGLAFRYNTNLSAWGLSNDDAHALACFFVQKADGSWVGGKFDWISSSRTTRGFENIFGGYNGWSLAGVPNPCNAAFVIVDEGCKRRSNVITATWTR